MYVCERVHAIVCMYLRVCMLTVCMYVCERVCMYVNVCMLSGGEGMWGGGEGVLGLAQRAAGRPTWAAAGGSGTASPA